MREPHARTESAREDRAPVSVRALALGALLLPPNILWLQSMELV